MVLLVSEEEGDLLEVWVLEVLRWKVDLEQREDDGVVKEILEHKEEGETDQILHQRLERFCQEVWDHREGKEEAVEF